MSTIVGQLSSQEEDEQRVSLEILLDILAFKKTVPDVLYYLVFVYDILSQVQSCLESQ